MRKIIYIYIYIYIYTYSYTIIFLKRSMLGHGGPTCCVKDACIFGNTFIIMSNLTVTSLTFEEFDSSTVRNFAGASFETLDLSKETVGPVHGLQVYVVI